MRGEGTGEKGVEWGREPAGNMKLMSVIAENPRGKPAFFPREITMIKQDNSFV